MNTNEDVIEVDLLSLIRALWHWAWGILLAGILCGGLAYGYTKMMVTPMYTASVLMYVNSSDLSVGGTKVSISQGELSAAQSLIDTYTVILKTRTTLNDVIEQAELSCSYGELVKMISAASVNSTEVFQIDVVNASPTLATEIANTIAHVLPDKIASIVEGSSARIVDMAVVPVTPTSPSVLKNVAIGALLGMVLVCGVIVVRELMDDKIYDIDYLIQTYKLPILATIPDLLENTKSHSYGYYGSSEKDR